MDDNAIQVHNLGKLYRIGGAREPYKTFREAITKVAVSPFKKFHNKTEYFWALKNVSFDVKKGEVVGVIGKNGAGKSTMLKILSKITEPSEGYAKIYGRVGSLLEVGTGFHSELTGRENIFLSGSILGMKKKEIESRFDQIVKFAETEKFLDMPLKHYSSGMQVRLGFAVAAHLETDVLIVDEVLAVGDTAFQKKSMGKMEDISNEGRTILFVSHNLGAIENLCNTSILLEEGRATKFKTAREGIYEYLKNRNDETVVQLSPINFNGNLKESINFETIKIMNVDGMPTKIISPSKKFTIKVLYRVKKMIPNFRMTFSVFTSGIRLFSIHDSDNGETLREGEYEATIELPKYFLRPGNFSIAIGGHREGASEYIWGMDLVSFDIVEEWDDNNRLHDIGVVNMNSYKFDRVRISK